MKEELILGAYKEPLRRVTEVYWYFGAISVSIDGKWEVRQDQTMGSSEAFDFLDKLYEEYKKL